MKKTIIFVMALSLTFAVSAQAEIVLYAGQDMAVGTVDVTYDAGENSITVAFDTTGSDWYMTETHVQVFTNDNSFSGITLKKGNPAPGQFMSKNEGLNTQTDEHVIYLDDLGLNSGDQIFVAAHAKVVRPMADCRETVWQIGDVADSIYCETYGDVLSNYADEFSAPSDASACSNGSGLKAQEPPYTTPFIVGTTPTNEFPYNSNYGFPYATDIDVQWSGDLPFGGLLKVSWSPGISGYEEKIVNGDGIPTNTTFSTTGAAISGQGWFMDKYPLVEDSVAIDPLTEGDHSINFLHTAGDGTFWDWIRLERPCVEEESAWAADDTTPLSFPGKNWATYFEYTVSCTDPVVGQWQMDLYVGTTLHDRFIIINDQVDGVIGGFFGVGIYPVDEVGEYISGNINGTVDCLDIQMHYDRVGYDDPTYTADFEGTIAPDGNSMSGTWSDNGSVTSESWNAYRL